jgi:hypothetical protein
MRNRRSCKEREDEARKKGTERAKRRGDEASGESGEKGEMDRVHALSALLQNRVVELCEREKLLLVYKLELQQCVYGREGKSVADT